MNNEALSFIQKSQYDGSDLYYTLLYQDNNTKPLLSILFAIEYEIINITTHIQDLGIARQKLHWWNEELLRYSNSEPRHPLTKALILNTDIQELICNRLLNAITNCQSLLLPYCFTKISDFQSIYHNNIGEFWQLTDVITCDNQDLRLLGQCSYYLHALKYRHLLQQGGRELLPKENSIFDIFNEVLNVLETIKIDKGNSKLQYAWIMQKLLVLHCKKALKSHDENFTGITPLRKLICARLKI